MIKASLISVILLLLLTPVNAFAIDSPRQEPLTITITGSNIPLDQASLGARQKVVTRKEIELINPRSVPKLLNTISGIYSENSASRGGLSSVYLRGAEANYTLVLIDGMKVNDPSNNRGGGFDFSALDVHSIDRIEIYKGAGSFLYGSAAIAGVINIITRQADSDKKVSVSSGSRGYADTAATFSHSTSQSSFSISGNYVDEGEQIEGSAFIGRSMTSALAWRPGSGQLVEMRMHYLDNDAKSFPDASGGEQYYIAAEQEKRNTSQNGMTVQVNRQLSGKHEMRINTGFTEVRSAVATPEISDGDPVMNTVFVPANSSDSDYQRHFVQVLIGSVWNRTFKTSLGLERGWETGQNFGEIDFGGFNVATSFDLSRINTAALLEMQAQMSQSWSASAGLRLDRPDHFDSESSPHVGLSYQLENLRLSADWSTGFKLPSFYALGHPLVGNPDFEPETSESYEFSAQYSASVNRQLSIVFFHSTYDGLIDFDDSGVLVARPNVVIKGVELAINHRFNDTIQLHFDVTRYSVKVEGDVDKLNKRPETKAQLSIQKSFDNGWNAQVLMRYVGEISDFAFVTGNKTLDDYWLLNASTHRRINNSWRIAVSIDNLLDKEYEESVGNHSPGVSARIGLSASW